MFLYYSLLSSPISVSYAAWIRDKLWTYQPPQQLLVVVRLNLPNCICVFKSQSVIHDSITRYCRVAQVKTNNCRYFYNKTVSSCISALYLVCDSYKTLRSRPMLVFEADKSCVVITQFWYFLYKENKVIVHNRNLPAPLSVMSSSTDVRLQR